MTLAPSDNNQGTQAGAYRALRLIMVLGASLGVILVLAGAILVYVGRTGNTELAFLGQRLKSSSLGIGAIFLGACIGALTIARGLKSFDSFTQRPIPDTGTAKASETVGNDSGAQKPTTYPGFEEYAVSFLPICLSDLARLGLSEDRLTRLVADEFIGHFNYFRFDLEDYTMPVKAQFLVYLNKVGKSIEFRRVLPVTINESKLASWNNILALYRKLTRLPYREEPEKLLLREETFASVLSLHERLRGQIVEHFKRFSDQLRDPVPESLHSSRVTLDERIAKLDARLRNSYDACAEAASIHEDLHSGSVIERRALGEIVACFEKSLQHLHKIILEFPPIA